MTEEQGKMIGGLVFGGLCLVGGIVLSGVGTKKVKDATSIGLNMFGNGMALEPPKLNVNPIPVAKEIIEPVREVVENGCKYTWNSPCDVTVDAGDRSFNYVEVEGGVIETTMHPGRTLSDFDLHFR